MDLSEKSKTESSEFCSKDQVKPLRNNLSRVTEHRNHLLKRGSYVIKPNELEMAWFEKKISQHCYLLISYLIFHSEDWVIWHSSLLDLFSQNKRTLRQAIDEALNRKMIVRQKQHKKVSYYVTCVNEWHLSSIEDLQVENSQGEISHGDNSHGDNSHRDISHPITILTANNPNESNKTNDDEQSEEGTSSCKIDVVESKSSNWIAKQKPSEVINTLKDSHKLKSRKNGYVDKIKVWNEIAIEVWRGKTDREIEEDLTRLINWPSQLPRDGTAIISLLEHLKSPEPEIVREPAFQSLEEYTQFLESIRDDMPY